MRIVAIVASLVVAWTVSSAHAAVDNPQYLAWKSFKPGSSETLAASYDQNGMTTRLEVTYTLMQIDGVKATVQISTVARGALGGRSTHQEILPAQVQGADTANVAADNISAMGRTFKCSKILQKQAVAVSPDDVMERDAQEWMAAEVPGGIVRMDAAGEEQADGSAPALAFVLQSFQTR